MRLKIKKIFSCKLYTFDVDVLLCFWTGPGEPVIISWDGSSPCQAHHVPKWTGPVLWYSTCLQLQNPKPNDRLSVGHSRSKGELRERERERILLHRGDCLGLLFDSEHGVFGHFCGIIFFQWHLWQLVKMTRLGPQGRKMPEKRYSITRKGRRRGSMTSQSLGTRLTLTTGSWSALIPAGMRVECSKKAPSQLCSHSTEVLSLSLSCVRGCRVVEIGRLGSSMPSGSCLFSSRIAMHWPLFSLRLRGSVALYWSELRERRP